MWFIYYFFLGALTLSSLVHGQLSGSVGPLTSVSSKKSKAICNVLDYGAKADNSTDLGTPLLDAFNACIDGGLVYVPSGNYVMENLVTLSGANAWALQIDGIVYRTGGSGGATMISIENSSDFELFSSTSSGAIQGAGYLFHISGDITGPRLLRLTDVDNYSVHDFILVDAPSFHFVMDTCSNGEVYNMAIRGGNSGGLDGIDVWGTNIWIHDIEVTNKDECVTTKSPSSNILVEDIYCNWSGGCAIGSLGDGTDIHDVLYRYVYSQECNQMMMIKSNGGTGSAYAMTFENFIGHHNAYSLNIDQYWSGTSTQSGNGVQLYDIEFLDWYGTEADGSERGPVRAVCADLVPCYDITIEDLAMWTEVGSTQWYDCRSSYGSGFCLRDSSDYTSYGPSTTTVSTAPAGYSAPTMAADLSTAFGFTVSIPIPTIPTSFFPGQTPISKLLG